jgi:hypothetical protein
MSKTWMAPEIEEQSTIVAQLCNGGGGHGSGQNWDWKPTS